MTAPPGPADPRDINTGSGSYYEGAIRAESFIGGNVNLNLPPQFLAQVIALLQKSAPPGDPLPQHLLDTLESFRSLHARLRVLKVYHHLLNAIVERALQFAGEVQLTALQAAEAAAPGARGTRQAVTRLRLHWGPVAGRVTDLLRQAQQPDTPAAAVLAEMPSSLDEARLRVDALLTEVSYEIFALFEATSEFSNTVGQYLLRIDGDLNDAAIKLDSLSQVVLGTLQHDALRRSSASTSATAPAA
jgi:hypothetical protein